MMRARTLAQAGAFIAALALPATQAVANPACMNNWSFGGPFGTFDKASTQRGFLIYQQICSACHSMKQMYYRNLIGIGLSPAQVKAVAGAVTVSGGVNDQGAPIQRPGLPADHFKPAFANDSAARYANGGALPPDQSVLELAREGGSTYICSLLTGYTTAPASVKMQNGLYYNPVFTGGQIAMPPPLGDDYVTYADGTKATLNQEAHDVATFLAWTANPDLDQRHHLGVKVVIFLALLTVSTYIAKRRIWADVH